MNKETFRKKVESELKNFTKKEDVVYFAWLCAVRALPHIGRKGHFNYWKENDRLKHLYLIFFALDAAAANTYDTTYIVTYAVTNNDAVAKAVAYAANAAVYAAHDNAAAVKAAACAYIVADDNFTEIALQDIQDIKEGIPVSNTDTRLYGIVWDNFQKALEDVGCRYWGRLYEDIFGNGLKKPDKEALETRLNVLSEIRAQGAAAVASCLERLENK